MDTIMNGLAIIQALSGFKLFSDIGLSDRVSIRKFIKRIKLIKKVCDYIIIYFSILIIIYTIFVLIVYMNFTQIIIYGIFSGISFCFPGDNNFCNNLLYISVLLYRLLSYYVNFQ